MPQPTSTPSAHNPSDRIAPLTELPRWLMERDAMLQALAQATQCLLVRPKLAEAIVEAIGIVAGATRTARVYVFEKHELNHDADTAAAEASAPLAASCRYVWSDPDSTPLTDTSDLQNLACDALPGTWLTQLAEGQVQCLRCEQIAPEMRLPLLRRNVESVLLAPILINARTLWGFVMLTDGNPQRLWENGEVSILSALASSVAAAIVRRRVEDRLQHESLHDALTGLPNRLLLADRVQRCIERARRRSDYHFAVLFLDVDRFKLINDSLGHAVGDQVLTELSRRLGKAVRLHDSVGRSNTELTVGRMGGDEFTLLLDDLRHPTDAEQVAGRLLQLLQEPCTVGGQEVTLSVSIGIVHHRPDYQRADELIRDADAAMHCAKAAGRARFMTFDTPMHELAMGRLRMENDLRRAIERGELSLHFQPLVHLADQSLYGFEALLRWQRNGKPISPAEFIPIAEESGMICAIGNWVLQQAVRQLLDWQQRFPHLPHLTMSVNVSRRQLIDDTLIPQLQSLLQDPRLRPECLKLEITESVVMDNTEAPRRLDEIKRLGFMLSMDDFGTGYSSLSCLHQFPIDILKIDRAFIGNMTGRKDTAALHAIVALAHELGMTLVAEGLETREQVDRLKGLNCDIGQGYYFAKPIPADAAENYLSRMAARAA